MLEVVENSPEDWRASLKGDPGLTNYQIAVNNGFIGTEPEWLASLIPKFDDLTEQQKDDLRGHTWRD
jgi:hypothetical protein